MKKLTFLLLFITGVVIAQSDVNLQKVIDAPQLTWFGLDFTDVKLIEDSETPGFNDPEKIRDYYFQEWNTIVYSEPEKYNFKNFLQKDSVVIGLDEINEWNKDVKIQSAIIRSYDNNPQPTRTEEELQTIVNKYSYEGFDGIGTKFIVTEMNKRSAYATGYLVYFDISSKKILYSRKMAEKAGGFGFRNYWMGAFYRNYREISPNDWLREEKKNNRKR